MTMKSHIQAAPADAATRAWIDRALFVLAIALIAGVAFESRPHAPHLATAALLAGDR